MCACHRVITYLVEEKSWNRPVIGHFRTRLQAVGVKITSVDYNRRNALSYLQIEISLIENIKH